MPAEHIMGDLLNTLGGVLSGSGSSSPVGAILQMLVNHRGGLGTLVNTMQESGLGDILSSWLSNRQNMPIPAGRIGSIFSSTQLQELAAAHFGGDQQAASNAVAEHLPNIIDRLSPEGSLPQGNDWMSEAGSLIGGLLK